MKRILPGPANLPFSKAIIHDSKYSLEISGQVGLGSDGKLEDGVEAQTRRILENIKAILAESGWSLENVVKVRIYLVDIGDYGKVNDVYAKFFTSNYPTRVALAVKDLPLGALVEIECTAIGEKLK